MYFIYKIHILSIFFKKLEYLFATFANSPTPQGLEATAVLIPRVLRVPQTGPTLPYSEFKCATVELFYPITTYMLA